jgi:hypothetical protein
MEEQIRKMIYDKIELSLTGNFKSVYIDGIEPTAKEITSHVFEFIEWMFKEEYFWGNLSETYFSTVTDNIKFDTMEELYNYWLNNCKK